MKVLVLPTVRPESLPAFFDDWAPYADWDSVIVVHDAESCPPDSPGYCWEDIDQDLGGASWIISRKNAAIRCFGFLKALERGAEWIGTLDDDCMPTESMAGGFFAAHQRAMQSHRRWVSSIPGFRSRGLPYRNLGELSRVVVNHGLWEGNPDLDAVHSLASPDYVPTLPVASTLIPAGQYFPFCSMNFIFHRDIAEAMYFPLMGHGSPYDRFDDIWAGVILKRVCDAAGLHISNGPPFVFHSRASDPFVNLRKEAPGILANETFWEVIDSARISTRGCDVESLVDSLGESLFGHEIKYISQLGDALLTWKDLVCRAKTA